MTKEIDYSILNKLTEEDIAIVSKNIDLDILLDPIKKDNKHYNRYKHILGRLDKKYKNVHKHMPKIATELFYKEDKIFYRIFAIEVMKLKCGFVEVIETEIENKVTLEDLIEYTIEDYIVLLTQIDNLPKHKIDIQLFILQLKLNDIEIDKDKEVDLTNQWRYHSEVKKLKEKFQNEKELLIKDYEIYMSSQLKNQKKHFETLLTEKECNEKLLQEGIKEKEEEIVTLKSEIITKNIELKNLEIGNTQNIECIKLLKQECSKFEETIEGLQNILNEQNEEYHEKLKKEWEKRNSILMKEKLSIEDQIDAKQKTIDELSQKEKDLLISLGSLQEMMDSYAADIEQQITNKLVATVEKINESNTSKQSLYSDDLSELYIIDGYSVPEYTMLNDNDDFIDMIEENLKNVGCKMKSTEFIDNISAAINANLFPLLCGFGTRKVALAFIAARYAEKPTVISIPNSFTNTKLLESVINEAQTQCVIIEDAFGKMSENILLPILRNNLKKQLIFCCEDINNLKYLDEYYYNYFQLIKIKRMCNGKLEQLKYGNASDVFKYIKYDNKSIGQQLVRYIIGEIDLLDTYKITRGNVISYLIEESNHQKINVIKMWMNQELNCLLTEEQREKIIENNDAILEEKL